MPLCPKCDIAYLDGETHTCPPRRTGRARVLLAAYVVGGAILGTLVVWILIAALIYDKPEAVLVLALAPYLGVPLGGWVGWSLGARRFPKTHRD